MFTRITVADNREGKSNSEPKVLGSFEYLVALTVKDLGEEAYPAKITKSIEDKIGRRVALAQVFIALERMQRNCLVTSRDLPPKPERGGRRRRLFRLEVSGDRALEKTATLYNQMASFGQAEGDQHGEEEARVAG